MGLRGPPHGARGPGEPLAGPRVVGGQGLRAQKTRDVAGGVGQGDGVGGVDAAQRVGVGVQGAGVELGAGEGATRGRPAPGPPPGVDGPLRRAGGVLPPRPQPGQGQVPGDLAAAVPPGAPPAPGAQGHRVAGDDVGAPLGEARPGAHARLAQPPHEVGLVARGHGRRPHPVLELLAVGARPPPPGGPPQVGGRVRPRPARVLAGLDDLQPVGVLDPVAGPPRLGLVLVPVPLGAVLAHDVDHDVDVVPAVLGRPVVHGHPPARGLPVGAGEAHPVGEVARDPLPLLVALRRLPRAQGQRAVPHVIGDRPLDHLALTGPGVEHASLAHGAGAGLGHELVDEPGDLESLRRAQRLPGAPPAHDHVRAGHQVRTGVLVGPPRAHEVLHQPGGVAPLVDRGDHRRTPARMSLMSSCSRLIRATTSAKSAGTSPTALAWWAIWFRFVVAPSSLRR